jgi:hypothetical protein
LRRFEPRNRHSRTTSPGGLTGSLLQFRLLLQPPEDLLNVLLREQPSATQFQPGGWVRAAVDAISARRLDLREQIEEATFALVDDMRKGRLVLSPWEPTGYTFDVPELLEVRRTRVEPEQCPRCTR